MKQRIGRRGGGRERGRKEGRKEGKEGWQAKIRPLNPKHVVVSRFGKLDCKACFSNHCTIIHCLHCLGSHLEGPALALWHLPSDKYAIAGFI